MKTFIPLLFLGLISVPPSFAQSTALCSGPIEMNSMSQSVCSLRGPSCDSALNIISKMSVEYGAQVIATRAQVSEDEQKASEDDFNRKLQLAKLAAKAACKN